MALYVHQNEAQKLSLKICSSIGAATVVYDQSCCFASPLQQCSAEPLRPYIHLHFVTETVVPHHSRHDITIFCWALAAWLLILVQIILTKASPVITVGPLTACLSKPCISWPLFFLWCCFFLLFVLFSSHVASTLHNLIVASLSCKLILFIHR